MIRVHKPARSRTPTTITTQGGLLESYGDVVDWTPPPMPMPRLCTIASALLVLVVVRLGMLLWLWLLGEDRDLVRTQEGRGWGEILADLSYQ